VRVCVAVVASVLLIAAPVSAHTTLAQQKPSTSKVTLRAFVLRPSGLLFSLHPTEARIVVSATANEALRVCEDGTTFSRHWAGGCRRLTRLPVALPTSGGAVHVGFRVMPSGATAIRVTMLTVRWHCVDHDFILLHGSTRVGHPSPTFDC
jgi:methionine-rich copper-binding protein CopC